MHPNHATQFNGSTWRRVHQYFFDSFKQGDSNQVRIWVALALSTLVLATPLYFLNQVEPSYSPILLSVQAIDESGHRVAGAIVTIDKKVVGRTDTFGVWKGVIEQSPENGLKITIVKQTDSNTWQSDAFIRPKNYLLNSHHAKVAMSLASL